MIAATEVSDSIYQVHLAVLYLRTMHVCMLVVLYLRTMDVCLLAVLYLRVVIYWSQWQCYTYVLWMSACL